MLARCRALSLFAGAVCGIALSAASWAAAPPTGPRLDLYGDPLPGGAVARLGTVRWRARTGLESMTFLPGGKYLVTGDGFSLFEWDLNTGPVTRTINGDRTPRRNGLAGGVVHFTPDG